MLSPRLRWKLARTRERWKDFFDRFFRSQPKPRVCFSCGALVGANEKACSQCGASQAAVSLSTFKRVALAVIPAETPITYALLFANFVFFVVAVAASQQTGEMSLFHVDGQVLYRLGAKESVSIWVGKEYWRLVMPNFLHWGLMHFGFNALALWQVGPQAEELFGSRRFLFLYLVTGVCGFTASAWFYQGGLSAGASASLFGVIGVLIGYISQRPGFAREYRASLIRWALFMLVIGRFLPFDNAAHLGGILSGVVLGRLVSDRRPSTLAARLRIELMAWGSAVVILWSLIMVWLHLPPAGGS